MASVELRGVRGPLSPEMSSIELKGVRGPLSPETALPELSPRIFFAHENNNKSESSPRSPSWNNNSPSPREELPKLSTPPVTPKMAVILAAQQIQQQQPVPRKLNELKSPKQATKYIKPLWEGMEIMYNLNSAEKESISSSRQALASPREEDTIPTEVLSPYLIPAYSIEEIEHKNRKEVVEFHERGRVLADNFLSTKNEQKRLTSLVYTKRAEGRNNLPMDWLKDNHRGLLLERGAAQIECNFQLWVTRILKKRFNHWLHVVSYYQGLELNQWLKRRACVKLYTLLDNGESRRNPIRLLYSFKLWLKKILKMKKREQKKAAEEIQRMVRAYLARRRELIKKQLLIKHTIAGLQIQRVYRGHLGRLRAAARRQYLLEMKSAKIIQKHWRRFMYSRKLQAFYRCRSQRRKYVRWRKGYITLQAHFRGTMLRLKLFRSATFIQKMYKGIRGRRFFRKNQAARFIQKVFRGFLCRREFKKYRWGVIWLQSQWRMLKRRRWYLIAVQDNRDMLKRQALLKIQERLARKKATIHSEARKIEGITIVFKIYRHSREAVTVLAYDSSNCTSYKFVFLESEIRKIAETMLGLFIEDRHELYKKKIIVLLVSKFVWSRGNGKIPKRLIVTEKGRGERGMKIKRSSLKLPGGSYYIITIFYEFGNFVFSAYNPKDCSFVLRTEATITDVHRWLHYHPSMLHKPVLLKPENFHKLLNYLMSELQICVNCGMSQHSFLHNRDGEVLCLSGHKNEERAATKIQGMWRSRKARRMIQDLIRKCYRKRFDPSTGYYYYVNTMTLQVTWTKPVNLRTLDLDVKEGWERMVDDAGNIYYFHASTGRTSWFSIEDACKLVQRNFRRSRAKDYKITDFSQIIKALKFQREAEIQYQQNPTKLTSMLNYALLLHTIRLDTINSGQIFEKCMDLASHSPIVLLAYSIWILATCKYPREKTWIEAQQMITSAIITDKKADKKSSFDLAVSSFYHWAIVSQPNDPQTLLNYALVQQIYLHDYHQAERFYVKSLHNDPVNKYTLINYRDFLRERVNKDGMYHEGGKGLDEGLKVKLKNVEKSVTDVERGERRINNKK